MLAPAWTARRQACSNMRMSLFFFTRYCSFSVFKFSHHLFPLGRYLLFVFSNCRRLSCCMVVSIRWSRSSASNRHRMFQARAIASMKPTKTNPGVCDDASRLPDHLDHPARPPPPPHLPSPLKTREPHQRQSSRIRHVIVHLITGPATTILSALLPPACLLKRLCLLIPPLRCKMFFLPLRSSTMAIIPTSQSTSKKALRSIEEVRPSAYLSKTNRNTSMLSRMRLALSEPDAWPETRWGQEA